jgi:hypothetical protein
MKRTPWISVSTPPVRPGEYEVKFGLVGGLARARRLWTGIGWTWPKGAYTLFGEHPGDKWRGLTEKH